MEYHLYEIILESPVMWVKIQASCDSPWQANAMLEARFGGTTNASPSPGYLPQSFSVPIRLSKCAEWVMNWNSIEYQLPDGWDDHEFRLLKDPTSGVRAYPTVVFATVLGAGWTPPTFQTSDCMTKKADAIGSLRTRGRCTTTMKQRKVSRAKTRLQENEQESDMKSFLKNNVLHSGLRLPTASSMYRTWVLETWRKCWVKSLAR